jgi:hypothetical protein
MKTRQVTYRTLVGQPGRPQRTGRRRATPCKGSTTIPEYSKKYIQVRARVHGTSQRDASTLAPTQLYVTSQIYIKLRSR